MHVLCHGIRELRTRLVLFVAYVKKIRVNINHKKGSICANDINIYATQIKLCIQYLPNVTGICFICNILPPISFPLHGPNRTSLGISVVLNRPKPDPGIDELFIEMQVMIPLHMSRVEFYLRLCPPMTCKGT